MDAPHPRRTEFFDGERRMQSVWKSGHLYGTLMGTVPATLRAAKTEAEAAARFAICGEHQERLAGLGALAGPACATGPGGNAATAPS